VRKAESKKEGAVEHQILEPMPPHMIKAYYSLRLLKSRDMKLKLLHSLNYFRSVQKRIAHDTREFTTRDRAMGGVETLDEAFGKQSLSTMQELT
jgi:hypothetical protein